VTPRPAATATSAVCAGTKRDAQRAAAESVTDVDRGGHRDDRRHTVNELLDRWMGHIETQGRAESTLARYHSCISANIKPYLGAKAITKVGPADLDRFYGQLAKTGLAPLSIRKSHNILSAAFNQAVRWGWIDSNQVLRASPPAIRGAEIHPPTRQELKPLLEACANDHQDLGSLIYVAATTGARRGELCGLRWVDVDLDLATLTIARSISDANQLVSVKDAKTHQARRIALDPATIAVLRVHRQRVQERAIVAGISLSPLPYVWSQDLDRAAGELTMRVAEALPWRDFIRGYELLSGSAFTWHAGADLVAIQTSIWFAPAERRHAHGTPTGAMCNQPRCVTVARPRPAESLIMRRA
jgi:integrase